MLRSETLNRPTKPVSWSLAQNISNCISALANCFGHAQRLSVRLRIMNPEDARAFFSAKAGEGNSGPKPLGSGGRLGEPAKKRFSRDAYQDRQTYLDKSIQRSEQSPVVFSVSGGQW